MKMAGINKVFVILLMSVHYHLQLFYGFCPCCYPDSGGFHLLFFGNVAAVTIILFFFFLMFFYFLANPGFTVL